MEVLLFGISKELMGQQVLSLPEHQKIATVLELKQWILNQYPEMGTLYSFAIAVDQEYADDETPITENQEIALIPPVSGG
ncbi:molybdopterin converting factor subunit 1 [Cyclobacterium jeungdonense]|uniref:Molybdopterin synthase sulfur carrier subunit n=1 Tax=Cyclobacterium jeungdonense TaxID=708087 RepID=A0ABT8CEU4_9BACT|nr:molybdopterin converting factor subunit 1 [Cyclobacterium jeungdonense]MDN3690303.1 molybdopterin converting factor subunit 1 [Cyclobacterium jeungdonense]